MTSSVNLNSYSISVRRPNTYKSSYLLTAIYIWKAMPIEIRNSLTKARLRTVFHIIEVYDRLIFLLEIAVGM